MATWDSLYGGVPELIRKMLYGSILVKDFDPEFDWDAFTPFATDGTLTDITASGFKDVGRTTPDGIGFAPSIDGSDTMTWQSREPARHDITSDIETCTFTPVETNPLVIALYRNVPIADVPAMSATTGWTLDKPKATSTIYRSILAIGKDGDGAQAIYGYVLYPRCAVTDRDASNWQVDTEIQYPVTMTPYFDTAAGTDIRWGWDGPGWRALTPAGP